MFSEDGVTWVVDSDDEGYCSGDWRIDFEDTWLLVHDLTPEEANHWRLMPWVDEIVKIRYPLQCQTRWVARRFHLNATHTWYEEQIDRGDKIYRAQGVVLRTGDRVQRKGSFLLYPPYAPNYRDVLPPNSRYARPNR